MRRHRSRSLEVLPAAGKTGGFLHMKGEEKCADSSTSQIALKLVRMEEVKSAVEEHMDLMADLIQKLSSELRAGLRPAYDNFIGFFHAIDWKEPWLIGLAGFHIVLLLVTIITRRKTNFQMCLFLLTLAGVYLAERLNTVLRMNWKSFSSQNYFDPNGLFMSVLWSGPLLIIAMIILINTLFSLCYLIVRWKRAELRHRARIAHSKEE
ncbi:hypothetical protein Ahy_B05g075761 [Arachis hypogaea]|uniref:Transmembrane protein 18 n=2 Tax=Arachis TaxID=3817 RepID=A0A444Z1X9_ARAHY|nr:hypothetical protein Ahy_B05g075761 [Arachis hypogaea]